jgi:glycosyltransferase involved in cell wall biosynthesis
MPVLILAHSYPPVSDSGAQRPYRFAKYLSRLGHPVEVLTSTEFAQIPSSPGIHRIPPLPATRFAELCRKLTWTGCAPLRWYDYGMTWVVDSIRYARRLVEQMGPCCVISTYPPLSVHVTALSLKRRYSIKWIADFRDPLYANPFHSRNWLVQRTDQYYETSILRLADAVLMNTDASADALQKRYPQWSHKISLLWNGYDPEEDVRPLPIPPRDHRVLAHVGSMYIGRDPTLLIDSLDRLIRAGVIKSGELKVLQIGPVDFSRMPNRELLDRMAQEGAIMVSGVRVPRPEALRAIQEADLLLLLDLNPGGDSPQVPAKVFDYVRAGRPILLFTNRRSPTEAIIRNSGIPHRIVYRDDPPERIDAQVSDYLRLPSVPVPPSEWFQRTFDGSRQALQLEELIQSL